MVTPRINSRVNPRIRSLKDALRLTPNDMRAMLRQVDRQFRTNERALFATEGASGGQKWPRLSSRYAKQKKRTHPGRKIMAKTGRLRAGLTTARHPDHVARYTLTQSSATIKAGTRNPVAAYHGAGGGRFRNPRLPVRDVMQMTPTQRARYYGVVRKQFRAKIDRTRKALLAGQRAMRVRGGG